MSECKWCGRTDGTHNGLCAVIGNTPLPDTAHTRRGHPVTSHEAARSVEGAMRASQLAILDLLRKYGPMTDPEIQAVHRRATRAGMVKRQSDSGLRARRSELVTAGLARDSGRKERGETGRRFIIWEAT